MEDVLLKKFPMLSKEKDIIAFVCDAVSDKLIRQNAILPDTKLHEKVDSVANLLSRFASKSTLIGQFGENIVDDVLSEFKDMSIVNSTKKNTSGDFVINGNIIIEVKNYTKSVPTSEIEKLKRDIGANIGIKAAIFIAFGSAITGHKRYDIEYFGQVPILFVPNASREGIMWAVILANLLARRAVLCDISLTKYYAKFVEIYNKYAESVAIASNIVRDAHNLCLKLQTPLGVFKELLDEMYANSTQK